MGQRESERSQDSQSRAYCNILVNVVERKRVREKKWWDVASYSHSKWTLHF